MFCALFLRFYALPPSPPPLRSLPHRGASAQPQDIVASPHPFRGHPAPFLPNLRFCAGNMGEIAPPNHGSTPPENASLPGKTAVRSDFKTTFTGMFTPFRPRRRGIWARLPGKAAQTHFRFRPERRQKPPASQPVRVLKKLPPRATCGLTRAHCVAAPGGVPPKSPCPFA